MTTDAQRLSDAKAAFHSLVTGQQARVVVDQNGQRVEFTAANRETLAAYIQTLNAKVCPADVCSGIGGGPVGFLF